MAFTIVRNDITKMRVDAIVNTANANPVVGPGCDRAVYEAAGYEELLAYRKEHIGTVAEGEVFLTPGFALPATYILHAVSPLFRDGEHGEEELLRGCYRKLLQLAKEKELHSIAIPLISTGGFGYPKEEGLRIAVEEINGFLLGYELEITLVVYDEAATRLGKRLVPKLEAYIDQNYVDLQALNEIRFASTCMQNEVPKERKPAHKLPFLKASRQASKAEEGWLQRRVEAPAEVSEMSEMSDRAMEMSMSAIDDAELFETELESRLAERMRHMTDTFSEYLMFLIQKNNMKNSDVYNRALLDKKVFSKIKNTPNYHPQKITALCLCVGAQLSLDETKDLLARAGYALSPCDKTDIIFSYFIENEIYDMIELDIQLEEHGLPCIVS